MLASLLPPEAQLLFLVASPSAPDSDILRLLSSKLDWVELCTLAEREKALPLLWRRIKQVSAGNIPAEAENHIRRLARVVSFHMSCLEQLVVESTACLNRAGIEYVLLKGAALSCAVYGSFQERPMIDVDLLVRPDQGHAAVQALLRAGWVKGANEVGDADLFQHHHFPPLFDPNGIVSAEVHTSLLPPGAPFGITTDEVFAAANTISFRETSARVPSALYLLLHTCIHFAWSHLFRTGAWRTFRDIDTLVNTNEINWTGFTELARSHRAETCCFWALHLAHELIGVSVPDDVLAALKPRLPLVAMHALERHFTLMLFPSGTTCPSVSLRRIMWSAGILPRRSGHSSSRPWQTLGVAGAKPPMPSALPIPESARSGNQWARYWGSVILASPAPVASKPPEAM